MEKRRSYSKAPWEKGVGYCRALRAGAHVFVTGTAPINDDGSTHEPGEHYKQAKRCLELIEKALDGVDAKMSDVVRTRMFVTDVSQWKEYGRAHKEYFEEHPPVTTMVEVVKLISPDMLIEIEVDAICAQD